MHAAGPPAGKAFPKSYRDRLRAIPNTYSAFSLYIKFREDARRPYVNHPCYWLEEQGRVGQPGAYDEETFPRGLL